MASIRLPKFVFEDGLPNFLAAIWAPSDDDELRVDFSRVTYFIPVAIAALVARIDLALRRGQAFVPAGLEHCENLRQHAGQRGFVCAQYSQKQDRARIGIADSGIGIYESFRQSSSPRYREGMDDLQTIELAMAPWSSSRAHLKGAYGESANKGVG